MKWLRKATTLALVAYWPLAAIHCKLESLPGLAFLACVSSDIADPHENPDCGGDACATVESGFYKSEDQPIAAPTPLQLQHFLPATSFEDLIEDHLTLHHGLCLSPPELSPAWQFAFRTALPVRAPSPAS